MIHCQLPNFISSFLSDRSFNVRIGSTLSDTFEQEQGIPQGSILSHTLFNIKINNIVKCVNDTDSSLYVDDFGIFYKSKNMENTEFRLQRCLNKVETWATENGFKFSKTKTQCVHHRGLRLALGAFRTSPVESLYAESNKPSLYTRREKVSLQYTMKLAANPKNPAHNCVLIQNTKDFIIIHLGY